MDVAGAVTLRRFLLLFLALATYPGVVAAQAAVTPARSTYDAVVAGMTCRQQTNGRLDCHYVIGESLQIRITGVGQEDAVVNFQKVDSTAGYVAGFAALHGCVMIRPAKARPDSLVALAFVSPRDGRVYRTWQHCRQPPRR